MTIAIIIMTLLALIAYLLTAKRMTFSLDEESVEDFEKFQKAMRGKK